jgi:hypothetical protein
MNALMTLLAVITAQAQTGFSLQLVDDTPVRTARWAEPLVTYWLQQMCAVGSGRGPQSRAPR